MSWEGEPMSLNKVMILGRLGQDPELKYTPSGAAVCNFSVATTETWTDKSGQKQERTEWHRIVVWGKLGELCNQYLSKGRQAFVEGALQTRSWEGKDGSKRYTTEINAKNVQFIGGQASAGKGDFQRNEMNQEAPMGDNALNQDYNVSTDANFTADDIPF
jgi:single-strand DNA-binding protein